MSIRLPRRRNGIDSRLLVLGALLPVALAFAFACGLDVTGPSVATTGPDAGPEASLPDGGGGDDGGPIDGGDANAPDASAQGEQIVAKGVVANASGLPHQTHLFFAENAKRWWALYITGTNEIASASSADLVTWTPSATLLLPSPHGNDGRVFGVGYRSIAGHDVVHIGISVHGTAPTTTDLRHYHARATVTGSAIAFGSVDDVSSVSDPNFKDPDGTVTIISRSNDVIEASGWTDLNGPENAVVFFSATKDLGTSWNPGFASGVLLQVVTRIVNSKALVDVGDAGTLALFESADSEPDPSNIRSSTIGPLVASSVAIFANAPQDFGDWATARIDDANVQIVRRTLAGTIEQARWNGSAWNPVQSLPAEPTLIRTGLALTALGTNLSLVAISSDASNTVREIRWDGAAWGAWKTIEPSAHARTSLSMCACGTATPAVLYTRDGDLVALPLH
jgi:hypothetical protein